MKYPRSPYDKECGLVYAPRLLDKIRLRQSDELPEAYHRPQGQGMDGLCCAFLHVEYAEVAARVKEGLSDTKVLEWCFANGRRPDELETEMWNAFMTKRGWRDEDPELPARLKRFKAEGGLEGRDDIETIFDYFEADEGRKS